jgi:6-phosphogluconolactonase
MLEAKEVAQTYEKRIREFFQMPHGIPSFDLALMGMGADGHTASMFPDSDYKQLSGPDTMVIAPYVTHLKAYRISLTLKVFNACKHIVFAVAGADKKKVFSEIKEGSREGLLLPASTVKPGLWLVLKEVVA